MKGEHPSEADQTIETGDAIETGDDAPQTGDGLPRAGADVELVGPGRFPLRIQPAAALQPGEADARRLLHLWFVRKSFYWILFLGVTIGGIAAAARHQTQEIDLGDPGKLTGSFVLVLVAFVLRFVVNWIALGLAFPLALAHEPSLSPRENFGARIGIFFDRLHVARSFRSLRWTHHVRQVAQHRLGDEGRRLGRLDPIFDVVNITMGVISFVALVVAGSVAGG